MKLGVDLDDVLCDFIHPFLGWYNRYYNANVSSADINAFDMSEALGVEQNVVPLLIDKFYQSWDFAILPPYNDAKIVVPQLKFDEKYLITARPHTTQFETIHWMGQHFPNTFDALLFGIKDKGKLCKKNICEK